MLDVSDISKLKKVYNQSFPWLVTLAEESENAKYFKDALRSLILSRLTEKESTQENVGMAVARRILLLIEHDDIFVDELSTGERLPVRTVTYLWQFLTDHLENEVSPDLFIDLYHQFDLLEHPVEILPDRALAKRQMSRWPTGLDPEVITIRERNKERIIACLIKKIERCRSPSSRFQFAEGISYEEKEARVREWWNTARFHLSMAIKSPTEFLITGGEALMSQNATLRKILEAVYKMAVRKRKANESCPEGEKYAELQRVRLGSWLLAYLPLRVTDELVGILREFKEKASAIGVSQFYIQTHFLSPLEVTPEARHAIEAILATGWTITNQLVYTVSASRKGHTAKLRQTLNALGVVCYYTFSVKGFRENYAVYTPNSRSLQEARRSGFIARERPSLVSVFMNTRLILLRPRTE